MSMANPLRQDLGLGSALWCKLHLVLILFVLFTLIVGFYNMFFIMLRLVPTITVFWYYRLQIL